MSTAPAAYGREYQLRQAAKYRDRANNHWKTRVELAVRLVAEHVTPRLGGRGPAGVRVVDVGCSIGTFAIEFAKRGYRAVGVDLDAEALEMARTLAAEEGANAEFVCADLADWNGGGDGAGDGAEDAGIDIAVAFDIFEHLHDDQMGALLATLRRRLLVRGGALVFHTFPTEFDYLFFENEGKLSRPLEAFVGEPPEVFERLTRAHALRIDMGRVERGGKTQREAIAGLEHCNPTTPGRLRAMLERAGYKILSLETGQLYPYVPGQIEKFRGQRIADRNLFGVAVV